eukprot:TRINITY_DN931_c2_g1_i1.p1 TRINITY_DN931_c2_g1~~TRINITY_DN931_c2_g1_i1.p1  ORF type:complete len:206 (-),score=14.29 TRINITY_DN931_c2_g1_i1:93-683(-)
MARPFLFYALLSSYLLVFCLFGVATSDVQSDVAKCGSQLAGMATCLTFVQGGAKAPTPDCCKGLKQVLAKSRECLCVLVKDRDDPALGIKINGTLALMLPDLCQAPVTVSECLDLLHLAPNSPEAQIFKQFGNSSHGSNGTASPARARGGTRSGVGGSSTQTASSGGRRIIWLGLDKVDGVWIWCLLSIIVMIIGI